MEYRHALQEAAPSLLQLYWFLCTAAAGIAMLPMPGLSGFRSAVVLSASRGKLVDMKPPKGFGPISDWTVPQKWFSHFYAIGSMATILVFWADLHQHQNVGLVSQVSLLCLGLFEFHLLRRYLETTLLMKYPPQARMHGIAYVYGLSYYVVVPLTLLPIEALNSLLSDPLNVLHGLVQPSSSDLLLLKQSLASALVHLRTPRVFLGMIVFLVGNLLQFQSHWLLARLSTRAQRSGVAYRIPKGGMFELVSCPHYFAEIIIYAGIALLAGWYRPLVYVMLCWVVVNLLLAAGMTQKWYRRQFKTYPPKRKALIPWVY